MRFRILATVSLAALAACSGGDGGGGVDPVNRPPTIAFIFTKIGVVQSVPVTLSVNVNDLDGDPLTVTWDPTRGTITPLNAENTLVQWNVPNSVGSDTITVNVTDGAVSRSVVEPIKVGWPFSGQVAPAVFQKSRSPYIVTVTGVPAVLAVTSTVIEAGTELLLETPGTVIDVTDTLFANGTPSEPIVIRPNVRNQTCGDDRGWWEGFKVYTDFEDGYVEMNYGEIWYAQFGVRLRDQGSATIRNSSIKCSGQNGVFQESAGTLILEDTEVSNGVLDGVAIGGPLVTLLPDSVLIQGCNIKLNGRTGLVFDLDDQLQEVPIVVEYTNFEFNGEHALSLARAVFPRIHFNRFGFGNGIPLSNIWVYSGYPNGVAMPTLSAACNFWGSSISNQAVIDATIRDSLDTITVLTRLDPSPWLNANPLVTPPTCTVP